MLAGIVASLLLLGWFHFETDIILISLFAEPGEVFRGYRPARYVVWDHVYPSVPWFSCHCSSHSRVLLQSSLTVHLSVFSCSLFWNHHLKVLRGVHLVLFSAVRSAKFIPRKQWVVACSDDMFIRVYNYNTMDKVKQFEAHTDYIRCVIVHPTLPYVLSCSDDMLIKLWDWEKGWICTQIFEGHSHYVMQVTFNPKDSNTFASASLDRTVKVRYQLVPSFIFLQY